MCPYTKKLQADLCVFTNKNTCKLFEIALPTHHGYKLCQRKIFGITPRFEVCGEADGYSNLYAIKTQIHTPYRDRVLVLDICLQYGVKGLLSVIFQNIRL